eukprot:4588385-Prymnesium_polylepis.1
MARSVVGDADAPCEPELAGAQQRAPLVDAVCRVSWRVDQVEVDVRDIQTIERPLQVRERGPEGEGAVPEAGQLGRDPDVVTPQPRVADRLADLDLVAIGLRRVDVAHTRCERGAYRLISLVRRRCSAGSGMRVQRACRDKVRSCCLTSPACPEAHNWHRVAVSQGHERHARPRPLRRREEARRGDRTHKHNGHDESARGRRRLDEHACGVAGVAWCLEIAVLDDEIILDNIVCTTGQLKL